MVIYVDWVFSNTLSESEVTVPVIFGMVPTYSSCHIANDVFKP